MTKSIEDADHNEMEKEPMQLTQDSVDRDNDDSADSDNDGGDDYGDAAARFPIQSGASGKVTPPRHHRDR